MSRVDAQLAYFENQATVSNPEFWARFGDRPSFAGLRVLDIGCGHGALSIEMAREGADVLGIDPNTELVEWAQHHLQTIPDPGRISLEVTQIEELRGVGEFDLAVSKDSFEHIADLSSMLSSIRRLLKPGGGLWVGFSPLYYSPRGDHSRVGMRMPWAHTLPLPLVYAAASRHNRRPVTDLNDLGLNGLTPARFRDLAASNGFTIETIRYNAGDKARLRFINRARAVRALERYATVSIYAVLTV